MSRTGVAVDVGNFAIKARFFLSAAERPDRLGEPVQFDLQAGDWRESLTRWFESECATFAAAEIRSVLWRVASVNPPPTRLLKSWVETSFDKRVPHHWQEVSFHDVPLKLDVRRPEAVGIDRLVAAWAAWRGRSQGKQPSGATDWGLGDDRPQRHRPVMVVDAGSALTVDLVDAEGTFRGGAILPGRQMQLRALGTGAFALPDLTQNSETPFVAPGAVSGGPECPGRDTEAAIQLGVFAGIVGAIHHLREAYQLSAGQAPELVFTGGDAPLLAGLFDQNACWVPNLLIDGIVWL